MRYLKGALEYGLCYSGDHDFRLYGYTDLDWTRSVSGRKSTSGCCFSLGSTMTSWETMNQSNISLSMTKEEYIVLTGKSVDADRN
jgi:hypothetical protein